MQFVGKKILVIDAEENIVKKQNGISIEPAPDRIDKILLDVGFDVKNIYLNKKDFSNKEELIKAIIAFNPWCIFNLFEGFSDDSGKESIWAKILEEIKLPFTGNSSHTLATCLNKNKVKDILSQHNIKAPKGFLVKNKNDIKASKIIYPCFVKPAFEDASLGIDDKSLVYKEDEIFDTVEEKLKTFSSGLLVEEFIEGKEYNVGVIGQYPYEILGVSAIDYTRYKGLSPFLTYNSKWQPLSSEFKKIQPKILGKSELERSQQLKEITKKIGEIFQCRNYFRVDLRERDGEIFVLDVNPNPDLNPDSGFVKQAYHKGYNYKDIVIKIIQMAVESFK